MDKLLVIILIIIVGFLILILGSIIWNAIETEKHCARWENKIVHQDAYTQFIPQTVGKITTMTPIYHSAREVEQRVCVEPK